MRLRGVAIDIHRGTVKPVISPSEPASIVLFIPAGQNAPSTMRSRPHELERSNGFWSDGKTTHEADPVGHLSGVEDDGV